MQRVFIVAIALCALLVACDKGDAPGGAASSAPASGASTKLTKAQLDEAYKAANPDKYDESVAKATEKLGKPQKSDATSSTWFGVDGAKCYQLLLTKAKGHEVGLTDKSSCGLK
jgi:hypothetical protein